MTATTESDEQPPGDERLAYSGFMQRMLIRPEIVGVAMSLLIYFAFWGVSDPFASGGATLLVLTATVGIMAVAVSMLMIGGEFDLSSGAMTGSMGIVIILLVKETGERGGLGLSYWIAIPISLCIALSVGFLNGKMVQKFAIPSFVVTLGTFYVLRGLKTAGSKIAVDQIQVGDAREGQHYDFWRKIFGSEWERKTHIWEARDSVMTVLAVTGGVIVLLAVYEFAFRRRADQNPVGLAVLVAGLAGLAGGVVLAHVLEGSDWLVMLVIAVGGVVSTQGLAMWRYEPLDDPGKLSFGPGVARSVGISIGLLVLAVLVALVLDSTNDSNVLPFITEQGLRAIAFTLLCLAAVGFLGHAAFQVKDGAPVMRAAIGAIAAVLTFLMALFVQSESTSHKFRAELFSILCGAALVLLAWSLVAARFESRRFADVKADHTARRALFVGGLLVIAAVTVRMLFSVQSDHDLENPARLATYNVRILWFIGFCGVMMWVLRSTRFGSWTFAVGGDAHAARQVGVPSARTKTQLFMLVSFAAWLLGLLLAFKLNSIQANTGNGLEFDYIIAAVVGGTALTGGYGSVFGAAIGAFIMAMSQQGPAFSGWNTDWRYVFLGLILLGSVYANKRVRSIAEAIR